MVLKWIYGPKPLPPFTFPSLSLSLAVTLSIYSLPCLTKAILYMCVQVSFSFSQGTFYFDCHDMSITLGKKTIYYKMQHIYFCKQHAEFCKTTVCRQRGQGKLFLSWFSTNQSAYTTFLCVQYCALLGTFYSLKANATWGLSKSAPR